MANDDLLSAAQKRKRTGRSFFPAANYPQGQIIQGSGAGGPRSGGYGGFGPGQGLLPPEQNPAYQRAINPGAYQGDRSASGSSRGAYAWITTPSGGQMRVPTASIGNLTRQGSDLAGSQVTQIGNQLPIDRAAAYARGYGAPTPSVQQFTGGPALVQGGVANPVSNLSPAQRIQYGQGGFLDYLRAGPTSLAVQNTLGGLGRNVASWFGGVGAQQAAQYGSNVSTGQPYVPPPQSDNQPRRYSDYGYY